MQEAQTQLKPVPAKTVSKGRLNLAAMRRETDERRGQTETKWGWLF